MQWLRDGLGLISEAAEIGPLAASCPDTEGVYLVPAFTGLGSPWWDPYARGTIVGITRGTGRAHLARAVVEAMAFQTRDVVEAMAAASGRQRVALRADGGASVMDLLLQLQADQLQVPVARPTVQETTALGAAYLAGLAEGVWGSLDEIAAHWQLDREFTPERGSGRRGPAPRRLVARRGARTRLRRAQCSASQRWSTMRGERGELPPFARHAADDPCARARARDRPRRAAPTRRRPDLTARRRLPRRPCCPR